MARLAIGIAGAGLLGRLLAWQLACAGHRISVFDPADGPQPNWTTARHRWRRWAGARSRCGVVRQLRARPAFAERGSLLLAHRSDAGAAQRLLSRLSRALPGTPQAQALDATQLTTLEPALQGAALAWLLPGEAQIDALAAMLALQAEAPAVDWHWNRRVSRVQAEALTMDGEPDRRFDLVFDARGTGNRLKMAVRGRIGNSKALFSPKAPRARRLNSH